MKVLLFSLLISPAFAQLEKPILDGRCGKIFLKIQNDIIRAEIPKKGGLKICTFRPIDGASSERPVPNATIYLFPVTCDGKQHGSPGFQVENISLNSFLQVTPKGNKGTGVFSVFSDKEASTCQFKVLDWKRVKKIAIKR